MIFVSRDKEIINFQADNAYFKKVKEFVLLWESGVGILEVQTSGSTGKPKIITLSREQVLASVLQTKLTFNLDQKTLFICNLSVEHIAGKLMIIRALELNSELLVISPEGDFIQNLGNQTYLLNKNTGYNFLAFVPLQMEKLLKTIEGQEILNTAKAILVGGAASNATLLGKIKEIRAPVYATYGMTETVTHVAIKRLNGEHPDSHFVGLEGTEFKLNEQNCLTIKNATTEGKWLETNDMVELISPKQFKLIGRSDNVINSGGLKLNLDLIERNIDSILNLSVPFFCYGIPDEQLGQKLVLCLESEVKEKYIVSQLKNEMPKFEVPKEVLFFKQFKRTTSGKIDKTKTINASPISDK